MGRERESRRNMVAAAGSLAADPDRRVLMEVRRSALVEYPAESMFDIIEQAEHYPAFVPWCAAATILERDDAVVGANIAVAWRGVRFELRTRNPKRRPEWLAVRLVQGPFRRFEGEWNIRALAPHACKVEFALRYEFDSALVRAAAGLVMDHIGSTFVDAFIARAEALHRDAASTSRTTATVGAS
jgi:ribosome-associated toxin RatA of RatAB toxin-antitoxin module